MDDVDRHPAPPRPVPERVRQWIDWFGPIRLVTSAVAVLVVCAGVWWLIRTPTPPAESSLPRAESGAAVSTTTSAGPAAGVPAAGEDATADAIGLPPSPGERPSAADGPLIVHVTGAVHRRGVYEFEPGERLADAIDRAGGATPLGRPHELNLAAPLTDGMRVVVPLDGEDVPPELRRDAPDLADEGTAAATAPVDVNTAGAAELETLPGVGPATAGAILTERERHGPFASVDDLLRVPGIGPAKLDRLRDAVTT